jgi:hypothetical protein
MTGRRSAKVQAQTNINAAINWLINLQQHWLWLWFSQRHIQHREVWDDVWKCGINNYLEWNARALMYVATCLLRQKPQILR